MPLPRSPTHLAAVAILVAAAGGIGTLLLAAPDPAPRVVASEYRAPPRAVPAPAPTPTPTPATYTVKGILPIEGPLKYGEWHWDETGAPAGPIVITVDLAARVLSVFRDGYEIGATAVIYGAEEKPTPLGVFPVTQKDADHRSTIYDGAPMPYMLRMTNDGISIHGSDVTARLMTHGCVGVPTAFAKKLFGQVRLGDKVIVTRGETLALGKPITAA